MIYHVDDFISKIDNDSMSLLTTILESITPPTSLLPVNDPTNDIAPKDTQYCYIVRPGQERSEFPQHGKCVVPTVDKELDANGEWNVFAGIEGRTEEYKFDIYVEADGISQLIVKNLCINLCYLEIF